LWLHFQPHILITSRLLHWQELQEIIATLKELLAALQGRAKELHDLFLERCEKTDQGMMVKKEVVADLNTQLMCLQQESFYFKNSLEVTVLILNLVYQGHYFAQHEESYYIMISYYIFDLIRVNMVSDS